jgi:quercetin dioxygenase-like cupin family protein
VLVGIIWSTPDLTFGRMELLAGQRSDIHRHGGDEVMYLVEGRLLVRAEGKSEDWFERKPGDASYVPEGVEHSYYNYGDRPPTATFLVAPNYLANGSSKLVRKRPGRTPAKESTLLGSRQARTRAAVSAAPITGATDPSPAGTTGNSRASGS